MTKAATRPAATVILIRPGGEVLLIQRSRAMSFFGGSYAFPGGGVDAADLGAAYAGEPWTAHLHAPAGAELSADRDTLYGAYLRAAARELKEETGVSVALEGLVPWARWITPETEPKRYDALFFLAAAAPELRITTDGGETVAHRWLKPMAALAAAARGEIGLPPPTQVTLFELSARPDALKFRGPIPELTPAVHHDGRQLWLILPGDPAHPGVLSRPWPPAMPTRALLGGVPPAFFAGK